MALLLLLLLLLLLQGCQGTLTTLERTAETLLARGLLENTLWSLRSE